MGIESYLLLVIILCRPWKVEANSCSNCISDTLGKESRNITFRPSDEHNCNCKWTIPKSIIANDNIAVVLLLQNVSLPMTSGKSGNTGTFCSGTIRFPDSDAYKCKFENSYCQTFASETSICTIEKIRDKLSTIEHKCISITRMSDKNDILYNAGNFAGYTKYFVIQYLLIDCTDRTTTFESRTNLSPSTKPTDKQEDDSTTNFIASSLITRGESASTEGERTRNHSATTTNGTQKRSDASKTSMDSTMIIIIAASGAGLMLVIVFAVLLAARFCKTKTTSTKYLKNKEEEKSPNQEHEMKENSIYGETINDHKPETIINEIYDTTPVTEVTNDEPCLYAVVGKKTGDKNVETEENIVIIEDEPSSVYAVVNKEKNNTTI